MRKATTRLPLGMLLAVAMGTGVLAGTFVEDFSEMPVGHCYPDGSEVGMWRFVYDGYGCNAFLSSNGNTVLFQQPAASFAPDETHASLVLGPAVSGDLTLEVSTATTRQLREGSPPNPWEVAWVLWHYTDDQHFYYFIPKANGWELGKGDPAYPGAQRFLATGSAPSFPMGPWYRVRVTQAKETIRVYVDGLQIATVTDDERPYSSGRVGLYTEDAEVYFDDVAVTTKSAPPARGREK